MRALFSLPVLDGVSGEIIGIIAPQAGMVTSMGSILLVEGPGVFIFSDHNGVHIRHEHAKPWIDEDEAQRWGFSEMREVRALAV